VAIPKPESILGRGERYASDVKKIFGNLSQTNHYLVNFSNLRTVGGDKELLDHIKGFGVDTDFISRNSGILCSEASLPGSSLATAEVKDNFMGIPQEFAHTRLYADIDFTFYIDHDYNNLRFFEGWIDYIGSGSGENQLKGNYYRRMRYPDKYKCQTMSITKFERDFKSRIDYLFINAFPKLVTAVPVSYGQADILKVSVSFNYDRYVVNPKGSFIPGSKSEKFDPDATRGENRTFTSAEQALNTLQKNNSLSSSPAAPTQQLANAGIGRDGNFGTGTYGQGMPSNPNLRSVTSEAEIRDRRNYGNTVPAGSFGISSKKQATNSVTDWW
jgi:hypothetical protein